jgi:hypothetical protein
VYDMYPWDGSSASARGRTRKPAQTSLTPQQQAVQCALDRRDNGGDSVDALGAPGQPTASPVRQ